MKPEYYGLGTRFNRRNNTSRAGSGQLVRNFVQFLLRTNQRNPKSQFLFLKYFVGFRNIHTIVCLVFHWLDLLLLSNKNVAFVQSYQLCFASCFRRNWIWGSGGFLCTTRALCHGIAWLSGTHGARSQQIYKVWSYFSIQLGSLCYLSLKKKTL